MNIVLRLSLENSQKCIIKGPKYGLHMVQKLTQIPRNVFEYSFKNASLNLQIADCIASESCPPSPLKRLEPIFFFFFHLEYLIS